MNDILLLSMPVIHRGYLELFDRIRGSVGSIGVFDSECIAECSPNKPDIAAIEPSTIVGLLKNLGYVDVAVFTKKDLDRLKGRRVLLVDDQLSRRFAEMYLQGVTVRWESVFLRWDRDTVFRENDVLATEDTSPENSAFMEEAYREAAKSSDWWRQVGAVLVQDGEIIFRTYNTGIPDDHEPYKVGAIRDFLQPGERPELASTIHAEQLLIARAAKEGRSLSGGSLYITHFPCSVCAKIISQSGIAVCYYGEGSSNIDGKNILESAGMRVFLVKPKSLV